MKRAALIVALVSLAAGSAAMASPGGRGHDDRGDASRDRHEYRHDGREEHGRDARGEHGRDYRPERRDPLAYRAPGRYGIYHRPHGYYVHRWVRGERLPVAFYARPYVIVDYGAVGLRVPPRGYRWVRVDGDAVLAAVATGIVLDSVFHVFD